MGAVGASCRLLRQPSSRTFAAGGGTGRTEDPGRRGTVSSQASPAARPATRARGWTRLNTNHSPSDSSVPSERREDEGAEQEEAVRADGRAVRADR